MSKKTVSTDSILLVEDELAIRTNYMLYLSQNYIEVYEAEDAESAYEIYKQKKPKIMIVDINLPGMSGIELVEKIRVSDFEVKIIMLTAQSDVKTLLRTSSLKLTDYLVKPIPRKAFKEVLKKAHDELQKFSVMSKSIKSLKDGYSFDFVNMELLEEGSVVRLTKYEKKLLGLLLGKTNIVFTYYVIINNIWGEYDEYKLTSLKTLMKNLRKKLPKDTIMNVFGVGYKVNT